MAKYRYIAVYIIAGPAIFKKGGESCRAPKVCDNNAFFILKM